MMKTKTMKTTILSLMMAVLMIFAMMGIAEMPVSAADGDEFVTVGDFLVKGDAEGYALDGDTLRFNKEGEYTIKNSDPSVATDCRQKGCHLDEHLLKWYNRYRKGRCF